MNLIQLKEKVEQKNRIKNQLEQVKNELAVSTKKLEKLKIQLKKEFDDVQRLEGNGISALFYSFLGNKVEKLDKERQEYVAAKLKYDQCRHEIESIKDEINDLQKQLIACGQPENEYKQLIEEKTTRIKESGDVAFKKFEQKLSYIYSQKKEVKEPIAAGERVLQGLSFTIAYLKKAINWGTFDMLGGGILATAAKHSNIDQAKELINDVQVWLRKFKRELADIQLKKLPDLSIEIGSFATFADYFFDNLIFDWAVQSKIRRSLDSCENVFTRVSKILNYLKESDENLTKAYSTIKMEFTQYIEKWT